MPKNAAFLYMRNLFITTITVSGVAFPTIFSVSWKKVNKKLYLSSTRPVRPVDSRFNFQRNCVMAFILGRRQLMEYHDQFYLLFRY